MAEPDFLAFADSMKRATEQLNQYGESPLGAEELEQAERHARLLAQIQEWVNEPAEKAHTYASENADHYRGFEAGEARMKAHVRRLLEQP